MVALAEVCERYLRVWRWLFLADLTQPTLVDWAAAGLVGGAAACLGVLIVTPLVAPAGLRALGF